MLADQVRLEQSPAQIRVPWQVENALHPVPGLTHAEDYSQTPVRTTHSRSSVTLHNLAAPRRVTSVPRDESTPIL
jgi:hypothetical protein